jgi:hypothetical protein
MNQVIAVLRLHSQGLLSKEATISALSFARGQRVKIADASPYLDVAKLVALQAGVMKGIGLAENLAGKAMGALARPGHDAMFQNLMRQHPAMVGKDPVRAKANFDYIMRESPHLIDHPVILGDYVGNMTALKTTDPATIKTIAETEKARAGARPQSSGLPLEAAKRVGDVYAKQLELGNAPSVDEQIKAKALERMVSLKGERAGDEMARLPPEAQILGDANSALMSAAIRGGAGVRGLQDQANEMLVTPESVETLQLELAKKIQSMREGQQAKAPGGTP